MYYRWGSGVLVCLVQDTTLRQFLLTNLVFSEGKDIPHWRVNLGVIQASLGQLHNFPHFKKPFEGPTLFIGGSRSQYISYVPTHSCVGSCMFTTNLSFARETRIPEIKRLFPKAVVSYIPGAGHWPQYEEPAQLLTMVTDFCTKHTLK